MTRHKCVTACTAGWPPGRKCHCSACGENFSCALHFDAHNETGKCVDPGSLGLKQNRLGVWVMEQDWWKEQTDDDA